MIGLLAPAAVLLLLDRYSKRAVRLKSAEGCIFIGWFFQIRYVASLKRLYQRSGVRVALILAWFVSLISAVALYHSGAWFQSRTALIGLGLALAARWEICWTYCNTSMLWTSWTCAGGRLSIWRTSESLVASHSRFCVEQ